MAGLGDGDRRLFFLFFFFGGVVWVMKISASSSVSSSTFRTCLRFLAIEGSLRGLLFFLAVFIDVTLSCEHSSLWTGLGTHRIFFLCLASGCSSSLSELGRAAMPLTSNNVLRLLEVEPLSALSVEVEGRGTRLLDVDGAGLDDCAVPGCGWARLLRDLLGRRCSVSSSSSSSKYAAQSQSLVDRFTVRHLMSVWSIRYFIIFLNVGSALNFSAVGARQRRQDYA